MDYVCDRTPFAISATGVKHLYTPYENISYVTVHFEDNLIAHFHLNWLAPVKVRRTLVGGSKKMLVYDDMESSEKVKVYDKGVVQNLDPDRREKMLTGYRNGDVLVPNLETTEALRLMAKEFIASIVEKRPALSDGHAGLRIVRMLEAAQESMDDNGRMVFLNDGPIAAEAAAAMSATGD
jgi:predicted dehydrogenase